MSYCENLILSKQGSSYFTTFKSNYEDPKYKIPSNCATDITKKCKSLGVHSTFLSERLAYKNIKIKAEKSSIKCMFETSKGRYHSVGRQGHELRNSVDHL